MHKNLILHTYAWQVGMYLSLASLSTLGAASESFDIQLCIPGHGKIQGSLSYKKPEDEGEDEKVWSWIQKGLPELLGSYEGKDKDELMLKKITHHFVQQGAAYQDNDAKKKEAVANWMQAYTALREEAEAIQGELFKAEGNVYAQDLNHLARALGSRHKATGQHKLLANSRTPYGPKSLHDLEGNIESCFVRQAAQKVISKTSCQELEKAKGLHKRIQELQKEVLADYEQAQSLVNAYLTSENKKIPKNYAHQPAWPFPQEEERGQKLRMWLGKLNMDKCHLDLLVGILKRTGSQIQEAQRRVEENLSEEEVSADLLFSELSQAMPGKKRYFAVGLTSPSRKVAKKKDSSGGALGMLVMLLAGACLVALVGYAVVFLLPKPVHGTAEGSDVPLLPQEEEGYDYFDDTPKDDPRGPTKQADVYPQGYEQKELDYVWE